MRVGLVSYPMLFQRVGGLQVQVRDTLAALRGLGLEASLFEANGDRLADFDIIHVFAAANGNHRIVEAARAAGVPVVLSSMLHPPWGRRRWDRVRAEWAERLVGRLTGWAVTTSYRQIRTALAEASRIVALGDVEKTLIADGYGMDPAKVAIVPNGVSARFFAADDAPFRQRYGIAGPFVLSVASVSPYKNQLGLAKALTGLDARLVLIGGCALSQRAYLAACREAAGERLLHVGELDHDDPLLASAYAAATVFALPSRTEVAPISVLEALAAGTPVILTKHNSLGLRGGDALTEVDPDDSGSLRTAVARRLSAPGDAGACRALVRDFSWEAVAKSLRAIYEELV